MKILLISIFIILGCVFFINEIFASVVCCYFDDNPSPSLLVSPPYGYITHNPNNTTNTSINSNAAARWGNIVTSQNYYINVNGRPNTLTDNDARQAIQDADNTWFNQLSSSSSLVDFRYVGDTTNKPSLFSTECGTSTPNGSNEIGFCNLGSGVGGQVKLRYTSANINNGTITTIIESDMVINNNVGIINLNKQKLLDITTHEFGHFFGLGDLYQIYGGVNNCKSPEGQYPVMCDSYGNKLQWGDKDGIRWLYPRIHSFGLSPSGTISGADSAVALVDVTSGSCLPPLSGNWTISSSCTLSSSATAPSSVIVQSGKTLTIPSTKTLGMDFDNNALLIKNTGKVLVNSGGKIAQQDLGLNADPDMAFVWGDYSSASDQTTIKAKMIWDISRTTGEGTVGSTVSLITVQKKVNDIGAAFYNVNTNNTPDLIITYNVLDPSDGHTWTYYMIFFDIFRSGNSFNHGVSFGPVQISYTDGDLGTDVTVFDMNNDGARDLVVMDSYPINTDKFGIYYYYGPLSSSGTVSSWSQGPSNGDYNFVGEHSVVISIPYPNSRLMTLSHRNADSGSGVGGYASERLLHFTNTGGIDVLPVRKFVPLNIDTSTSGFGAGDAIILGEQSYLDQLFSWTNSNTGFYVIEWDSRLNSHL